MHKERSERDREEGITRETMDTPTTMAITGVTMITTKAEDMGMTMAIHMAMIKAVRMATIKAIHTAMIMVMTVGMVRRNNG